MKRKKPKLWLVFEAIDRLPHESNRDRDPTRPHYLAGARWYSPGFGPDAAKNRTFLEWKVAQWTALGYRVRILEEIR